MATMEQADGSYPRINGELMGTGAYNDMIVSMVGRFDTTTRLNVAAPLTYTHFVCCDNQGIELVTEYAAALPPEVVTVAKEMVFELIGQVQADKLTVFVVRPLSADMDLSVYNSLLMKVQHNAKYMKEYFPSSAGNGTTSGMVTG